MIAMISSIGALLGKLTKFAIVLLPCSERGLGSVTLGKRTCKTWPQLKAWQEPMAPFIRNDLC
jgi:hypothetical protein